MRTYLILYTVRSPVWNRTSIEERLEAIGALRWVGHETAWLLETSQSADDIAHALEGCFQEGKDNCSIVAFDAAVSLVPLSLLSDLGALRAEELHAHGMKLILARAVASAEVGSWARRLV